MAESVSGCSLPRTRCIFASTSCFIAAASSSLRQVYEAKVASGNGTEEQRISMLKIFDELEKDDILPQEQMRLSSASRFVRLEKRAT